MKLGPPQVQANSQGGTLGGRAPPPPSAEGGVPPLPAECGKKETERKERKEKSGRKGEKNGYKFKFLLPISKSFESDDAIELNRLLIIQNKLLSLVFYC